MSQDAWILLLLKIGLIAGAVSLVALVVIYTWLTKGGAWRNPIGQTLIAKTLLIAAATSYKNYKDVTGDPTKLTWAVSPGAPATAIVPPRPAAAPLPRKNRTACRAAS